MKPMQKLKDIFLNSLFPSDIRCILCGAEINNKSEICMCEECTKSLPVIENCCKHCGIKLVSRAKYCLDCKEEKHNFTQAFAPYEYDGAVKTLIHKLKYENGKYLAENLGAVMAKHFKNQNINVDVIIPVPLSEKRQKERGYNQSLLLANCVGEILNIPVINAIKRVKDTPTQTSLTRTERLENLKDAFEVFDKPALKGKIVLIIDDTFTTGATSDELSKTIKRVSRKSVYVLTAAHTPKPNR